MIDDDDYYYESYYFEITTMIIIMITMMMMMMMVIVIIMIVMMMMIIIIIIMMIMHDLECSIEIHWTLCARLLDSGHAKSTNSFYYDVTKVNSNTIPRRYGAALCHTPGLGMSSYAKQVGLLSQVEVIVWDIMRYITLFNSTVT